MHYSTASESNKAEEEQRKWEAERERERRWNKGSDERAHVNVNTAAAF